MRHLVLFLVLILGACGDEEGGEDLPQYTQEEMQAYCDDKNEAADICHICHAGNDSENCGPSRNYWIVEESELVGWSCNSISMDDTRENRDSYCGA